MNKLALLSAFLALMSGAAFGQSTAQPVQLGTLTTSGCPSAALTPCWKPISASNPLSISTTGVSSISLTTSGTSGAATLVGSTLNVPIYSSGSGSSAFSALTASTSANTIDNLNFANTWNWSTLTTGTGLSLSATGITSGTLAALSITTTGAAKAFSSTVTGAANTGYAGYFSNTATTGYAGYFNGNVTVTGSFSAPQTTRALGAVTTYTVLTTDMGLTLTTSNSATAAVTLPQAGTLGFENGKGFTYINQGGGAVTYTPTTSKVNGASTIVFANGQGGYFLSDGTNYSVFLGSGAGSSGTVSSGTTGQLAVYTGATTVGSTTVLGVTSTSATVTSTTQPALTVTSSASNGAWIYLNNTQTNGKQIGISSGLNSTNTSGFDIYNIGTNDNMVWFQDKASTATLQAMPVLSVYGFTSGNAVSTAIDTGISRDTATVIDFGNGTQADQSGTIQAKQYRFKSTTFAVSGCSASTPVGGATGGKFTIGANSCTATVTMGGSAGATGFVCFASDETAGLAIAKNGGSGTTATFAIPAGAAASDIISFGCFGY